MPSTSTLVRCLPIQPQSLAISYGVLAVVMFSLTAPMTKLALMQFSAEFIASSRGLGAGLLSLAAILIKRWALPSFKDMVWLALAGIGIVVGFPYLLGKTLTVLDASTMGIVLAGLPLTTALMAVLVLGERYSRMFWLFAVLGAGLLISYFMQQKATMVQGHEAIWLALATLLAGGLGYACGAKAAMGLGAWPAICWVLALYLPVSGFAFGYHYVGSGAEQAESATSWFALLYLVLVSQWFGFKFWYHAMATSSVGSVSQLQLIQPFFTLVFAALFLNETILWQQCVYAIGVVLSIAGALHFQRR